MAPRAAVVLGDERADAALHRDVQADGRLVEEDHPGPVQQRGGHLAFHPLAQGKVAHRLREQRLQVQQCDKLVERPAVVGRGMR